MKRSGLNVFLTEVIIMVGVFALALSICLNVFLSASNLRQTADKKSNASSLVYSAAQCYNSTGSIVETVRLMDGEGDEFVVDGCRVTLSESDGDVAISAYYGDELYMEAKVKAVTK